MKNNIYKMNQAEGIFYPAFDKNLCQDEQVSIEQGRINRMWDSLAFRGGRDFTIHWAGEVELEGFDSFLCFLGFPQEASMSAVAVVDGQRIELFDGEKGSDAPVELGGKLRLPEAARADLAEMGGTMTDVYLHLESPLEQNVVVLSWLGLRQSARMEEARRSVPVWDLGWEDEVIEGTVGTIDCNMVLTPQEGEHLRELVQGDEKLTGFFRENAQKAMRIDEKSIITEYAPQQPHMYRFVRVADRGRESLEGPVLNLAIAGYLLEEPSYSRKAARLILALTAMKWYEGPECGLEGSQFHHVCFTEDHMLTEVTLAMGFLGGVLKETARERIADKVEQAWKIVCEKCKEPGYRNFMNQGVVGNRGALLGAVYLHMSRSGYEDTIMESYLRHTAIVETYLTSEGHCAEGGSYFEYSFQTSILLWHVYSRYSHQGWEQVVPNAFRQSGRYQEAVMSVNSRYGKRIPLNCGEFAEVSTLLLVFMTLACDFPEGSNYLIARFEGEKVEQIDKSFDMLFYLFYREQVNLHPYYRPEEEEISLPQSGLLSYRHGSTKLVVTAERNPYTGHFHEDRGGIVLEAEGEILLPELGTTGYSNPVCLLMDKQAYHNIACPADLAMLAESEAGMTAAAAAAFPITEQLTKEDMEMPEARVVSHSMENGGYSFCVETGMLYGTGITGTRCGQLGRGRLQLTDSWQFEEVHPLMVTYLSYDPWKISGEKGLAESGRMELRIDAAQEWDFELEEGMVDHGGRHVYILRVRTVPALVVEVRSLITWKPIELSVKNTGWENRIALQERLDQGGTIRIEQQGEYEIEDTLYIKDHTHLIFGKGVSIRRAASGIGSFAVINRGAFTRDWDEDIAIEGLRLTTNGVEARTNAAVYGLTGEISLFYVKHLRIIDFACMDLPRLSFGLHICRFEDIILDQLVIEGRKDAVHLGTGRQFVIRHGIFRTFDDPIALNAHDYAVANPQMGWIEDGLIEDCYDLPDQDTTGYFCRILAGSWCGWYQGMEIQNSDTVVNNGRVYRAFQKPDGTKYISLKAPSHEEGMCTLDEINWVMVQEETVYNCGCRNLHFKDIHLQKKRETALSIHFDHDQYSRSVYPGSQMPVQENIVFENMVIQNKTACMVRSITPVNTVKIVNSVIGMPESGNSRIRLETLPGQEGNYPQAQVLLSGNTCYGGPEQIVDCEEGRDYRLISAGNLILTTDGCWAEE